MKTNQKIQNLVKQLEDKDREGKNQINTIQKENAKQLERIKKENQSLNDDKRKNLALIKEYEIQDNEIESEVESVHKGGNNSR